LKKVIKTAQTAQAAQTEEATPAVAPKDHSWEDIAKFAPMMSLTIGGGTVIGFVEGLNAQLIRMYAPAVIKEMAMSRIAFVPLFGVERFMDLRQSVIFATMPIPKIFLEGYLGYFEQFAKGSYQMKPVVVSAGIDTPGGIHTIVTPLAVPLAPSEPSEPSEDSQAM